jgi:replicative DNA helicase
MEQKPTFWEVKEFHKNQSLPEVLKSLPANIKKELLISKLSEALHGEDIFEQALKSIKEPEALKKELKPYLSSLGDGTRQFEGLETGFSEIDQLIGGLSRFTLMAGMGGVGKTTLALQLALGVCEIEQAPVIYYSFEMSRRDIITMILQNKSRKLQRADLELRGNAKDLTKDKKDLIKQAKNRIKEISQRFYIVDASNETPDLTAIKAHIVALKEKHKTDKILIILDSLQDIVPVEQNQVQAEAHTAQKIVELQQETGATILAIAQKNKAGVREGGGYASVYGSVAFIHKPTCVLEMIGGQEAVARAKEQKNIDETQIEELERSLREDTKDAGKPYPIFLNIIKGRNCGFGGLCLKYYGAFRYYEAGKSEVLGEVDIDDIILG